MIELSTCVITLIDNSLRAGVPSIFRTMLEAYVELKNLHTEAKYGYYMEANSSEAWIKLIKESKKGSNPYLLDMTKSIPDIDSVIMDYEKKLDALKTKGFKPISIYDRFVKAGMENEYRSIYSLLSMDAHSNIQALIDRHIEIQSDGDFQVVYYKDEPLEQYILYIDFIAGILTDSSKRIHEIFKSSEIGVFNKLDDELKQIRDGYL